MTPTPEARFWARVRREPNGCWIWTGYVNTSNGYGIIGRCTRVHRYAYELFKGPIPAGLHIDHLCRRRLCVNPDHLEAVTQAENNRRAREANGRCPNGHPYTAANLGSYSNGPNRLKCRICYRARDARKWAKRRATEAA